MILYASQKTDIPYYYMNWFIHRIEEGFFDTRGDKQSEYIRHELKNIEKIMFFTKDPSKFISISDVNRKIHTDYELITSIAMYDKFYDSRVSPKNKIFEAIKKARYIVGAKNGFCYGPIFASPVHDIDFHINQFAFLCRTLKKYVSHIYVSFYDGPDVDKYGIVIKNFCEDERQLILDGFKKVAIEQEVEFNLKPEPNKDIDSIDIGEENSCPSGCTYCICNRQSNTAKSKYLIHNPESSLLFGTLSYDANIISASSIAKKKTTKAEPMANLLDLL